MGVQSCESFAGKKWSSAEKALHSVGLIVLVEWSSMCQICSRDSVIPSKHRGGELGGLEAPYARPCLTKEDYFLKSMPVE